MATPAPIVVQLTQDDIGRALAVAAATKAGVTCSYQHSITINGIWETFGDSEPVTVSITPMPNVVRLERKND